MKLVARTGEQIVVVPIVTIPVDVQLALVVPPVEDRIAEMYTVSSASPLLEIFTYP
jgi:hypothetical protein